MKKLKRILIVIGVLLVVFAGYVEIVNRNLVNMTYRQKVLKAIYPAFMWYTRVSGKRSRIFANEKRRAPAESIYDLSVRLNDEKDLPLASFKGKKILLVNTASECGYTRQYAELQRLGKNYADKLVILGFPANDFNQEKGSDKDIAVFCRTNFGVNFPLATKSRVAKGPEQQPVFKWLSDKRLNGWNDQAPSWNFSKYLVDEQGTLIRYFDPAISPLSEMVKKAIEQ